MRKIKLTWAVFALILQQQENSIGLLRDEEIKEITLMKPKEILIRAERRVIPKSDVV